MDAVAERDQKWLCLKRCDGQRRSAWRRANIAELQSKDWLPMCWNISSAQITRASRKWSPTLSDEESLALLNRGGTTWAPKTVVCGIRAR